MDEHKIRADIWRTERLLANLGYAPPISMRHLDPPEPDVAVELPEGVIGVELTELNPKGQLRRENEEEEERVTLVAKDLYDAAGLPPLEVKVCWSGDWKEGTMTRARRSTRAKQLKDFITRHIPENISPVFLNADRQPDIDFPEGVHYVSMIRLLEPPSSWNCPHCDQPPEIAV